jgi:hypothetical protein
VLGSEETFAEFEDTAVHFYRLVGMSLLLAGQRATGELIRFRLGIAGLCRQQYESKICYRR